MYTVEILHGRINDVTLWQQTEITDEHKLTNTIS